MASEIATKAARLPFGLRESTVILSRTTTARERTWDEAQHARLRANDVARLDVVLAPFTADPGLSLKDQPVLVEVVKVAVKPPALAGHAENAGAGDLAPLRPVAAVQRLL